MSLIKPVGGRPGLPGNAIESIAATTTAANSGLWTLGFKFTLGVMMAMKNFM